MNYKKFLIFYIHLINQTYKANNHIKSKASQNNRIKNIFVSSKQLQS